MILERQFDAAGINAIINDPDVRPFVGAPLSAGEIDLGPAIADRANVNLVGEHGGMLLVPVTPAIYEIHTHVRRSGRGAWAVSMVKDALHYAFTSTDAVEVLTKVPRGNVAARAMTRVFGGFYEFTADAGWISGKGESLPVSIYSLTLQDWARRENDRLSAIGEGFLKGMVLDARKNGMMQTLAPVPREESLYSGRFRALGLLYEMVKGGQVAKAGMFFNRWAGVAGAPAVEFLTDSPVTINFSGVLVIVRGDGSVMVPYVQELKPTRH